MSKVAFGRLPGHTPTDALGTRRKHALGFTLSEILIVLAVLSILASLLFAVVGHVREKGRQTTCLNTLRQLTLALQQYTADNDGIYPDDHYQPQLLNYMKPSGWSECPTHEALSEAKEVPLLLTSTYYPDKGVNFYIYGYLYNGARLNTRSKTGSTITLKGRHEAALDSATTWSFGDAIPYINQGPGGGGEMEWDNCGSSLSEQSWAKLHNGGANYSFLDGHTRWLTPAQIDALHCATSSGKE